MGLESALKIEIIGFNTMSFQIPNFFNDLTGKFAVFYDIPFSKKDDIRVDSCNIPYGVYSYINLKSNYSLDKKVFCKELNEVIEKSCGVKVNEISLEGIYLLKDNFTICIPIGTTANNRYGRSLAVTNNIINSIDRRKFITDLKIFLAEPQMRFAEHYLRIKYSRASISSENRSQFETAQNIIDNDIEKAFNQV